MKKALLLCAMMSLGLAACSDQNAEVETAADNQNAAQHAATSTDASHGGTDEDEFFELIEARLEQLEALDEDNHVCMSRWAEVSEREQQRLRELSDNMQAKHGSDVPEQYQERADQIDARMESVSISLTQKIDPEC